MAEILTLKQGIERAKKIIGRVSTRPILAAVYGWPNSGKSYFIHLVGEHFRRRGLSVGEYGGGPHPDIFELIRDSPAFVNDLHLFHCGWERGSGNLSADEDPNILAKGIIKRKLDLNVGIFNPDLYSPIQGDYDLIISNPNSVIKNSIYSIFLCA